MALAASDLNGDGCADLAIGVPLEDMGAVADAGAVAILYGSSTGLTANGNQIFFHPIAMQLDEYGHALATGDFDHDGHDDLAVGIPKQEVFFDLGYKHNAGAVHILYGAADGLYSREGDWNDLWTQDRLYTEEGERAESGDWFGAALAAGDFDHDHYVDLAVGIRYEDIGGVEDAGAVQILYGSPDGISAAGNRFWHQDSPSILGVAEAGDQFGCALAAIPPERHRVHLPQVMRNHQP